MPSPGAYTAPGLLSKRSGSSRASHLWRPARPSCGRRRILRRRGRSDERPCQPRRRKSDPLDARRIAPADLPVKDAQLRHPRQDGGGRAALHVLIASRDHISNERTAAINALYALLRVVDPGIDARGTLTVGQIAVIAAWRSRTEELATCIARTEAVRLAKRARAAHEELTALARQMTTLLKDSPAAGLLDQSGIGPVTAAIAFAAWSHPGRLRSEAAFANLAGVNPIPASSGNTVRHRINRGGDRRLNRALHMAVLTRMRMGPTTRAYVEKRTSEGRTFARSDDRSSATSPDRSTGNSTP